MTTRRTAERFALWAESEERVNSFFEILEEFDSQKGRSPTFQEACRLADVPYTLMFAFVERSSELKARYQAILQANAEQLVEEALDDVAGAVDRDTAAAAKVKAETKLRVASKWNAERYGDKLQVEKSISVTADAGLLTEMGELLKLSKRKPRVLEHAAQDAFTDDAPKLRALEKA